MIIDARVGDGATWYVFDVKRCAPVKWCVWVNDATAQWGRYVIPHRGGPELLIETVQEERITIYPGRKLILFNEVDLEPSITEVALTRLNVPFRSIKHARG